MNEIIAFSAQEATPHKDSVLENQGIGVGTPVPANIDAICARALDLLANVGAPVGILSEISPSDFELVYLGEGRNEPRTPVGELFKQADNLALFAVTLGERVSQEIYKRFRSNEFALGAMLDAAASAAADKMADLTASRFLGLLSRSGRASPTMGVLGYSPGYCGWHISGQKKLFEFLRPEQIGITLTESFLMLPLKSVSGVLVAGPKEIHNFPMSYPVCSRCETRGCRARIRALLTK